MRIAIRVLKVIIIPMINLRIQAVEVHFLQLACASSLQAGFCNNILNHVWL